MVYTCYILHAIQELLCSDDKLHHFCFYFLGMKILIKLVTFEGECILMLLRSGLSHNSFLGTDHQITVTLNLCSISITGSGKLLPPQDQTIDSLIHHPSI